MKGGGDGDEVPRLIMGAVSLKSPPFLHCRNSLSMIVRLLVHCKIMSIPSPPPPERARRLYPLLPLRRRVEYAVFVTLTLELYMNDLVEVLEVTVSSPVSLGVLHAYVHALTTATKSASKFRGPVLFLFFFFFVVRCCVLGYGSASSLAW